MAHADNGAPHAMRSDPLGFRSRVSTQPAAIDHENGVPIDVSATIESRSFSGAQGLGQYIHDNPQYPACVARRLYSYSRGVRSWSVNDFPDAYQAFQNSGFRLRALLKSMVLSDSFYAAAPPATAKEVASK